jgi:hypothetical protein
MVLAVSTAIAFSFARLGFMVRDAAGDVIRADHGFRDP